jgi:hypothetical protein
MKPSARTTAPSSGTPGPGTDLRPLISGVRLALATPAAGTVHVWVERLEAALVDLSARLRALHLADEPAGSSHDVLTTAPRLSNAVGHLTREHVEIIRLVDSMLARLDQDDSTMDVERTRHLGLALLDRLNHHRQRGSDLLFEAYLGDIGGES